MGSVAYRVLSLTRSLVLALPARCLAGCTGPSLHASEFEREAEAARETIPSDAPVGLVMAQPALNLRDRYRPWE
jgi:hypothetical protein